jgi:hypothetical protein
VLGDDLRNRRSRKFLSAASPKEEEAPDKENGDDEPHHKGHWDLFFHDFWEGVDQAG